MAGGRTGRRGPTGGRRTAKRGRSSLNWANLPPDSLPSLLFPADLLGLNAPERARVEIDFVITDARGDELLRLQLQMTRRLRGGNTVQLWGTDKENLLAAHLVGRGDGAWTFYSHITADALNGQQFLHFLDFIEALRPPNQVALAMPGRPAGERSTLTRAVVSRTPPPRLRRLIEAHAAFERSLGIQIPVPVKYSPAQGKALLETAALLRGETVADTWSQLDWPMPVTEARVLLSDIFRDEGQAVLEYEKPWIVEIGEHRVEVGTVLAEYRSARVSPVDLSGLDDDDDVTLELLPGDENAVTYRLLEGSAPRLVEGSVGTEPLAEDADQRWFWTPTWQQREREVDSHIAEGDVRVHDDVDAFLSYLDRAASDTE